MRLVYSRQHSARAGFGIRRTGMTPCVCGDRGGLTDTKGTNSILGKKGSCFQEFWVNSSWKAQKGCASGSKPSEKCSGACCAAIAACYLPCVAVSSAHLLNRQKHTNKTVERHKRHRDSWRKRVSVLCTGGGWGGLWTTSFLVVMMLLSCLGMVASQRSLFPVACCAASMTTQCINTPTHK